MSEEREIYRLPEGRTMALETPVKIYHRDIKHRPIEYIRADVAAAQLAERDARIAELEASRIGYRHVAETEADLSLELEKRIAELEAGQAWVSVDERLPDVRQWVLVRIDGEMLVFRFDGGSWSNEDEYIFAVSDVTHWMPLPPPPVTGDTP